MPGSASRERVGAVGMIGAVAVLTPVVTGLIGVGGKKQEEEARREKETPVVTGLIGVGGKIQEEQHFWKDRDKKI